MSLCLVFGRQLARDQKKEIPNEQFERACLNVDVIKGRVRLIAVDEPASEAVTLFEESSQVTVLGTSDCQESPRAVGLRD